ncbi:MAG: type II toxin-antitoxin system RelE family toxin [Devosia sp.]
MKTVVYSDRATKQLDALPHQAREQVIGAVDRYAMSGIGDVKKLTGRESYRLRVGSYRVIFDEDQVTVIAVQIGRRDTTTYR